MFNFKIIYYSNVLRYFAFALASFRCTSSPTKLDIKIPINQSWWHARLIATLRRLG
jgi:hypothetical protein